MLFSWNRQSRNKVTARAADLRPGDPALIVNFRRQPGRRHHRAELENLSIWLTSTTWQSTLPTRCRLGVVLQLQAPRAAPRRGSRSSARALLLLASEPGCVRRSLGMLPAHQPPRVVGHGEIADQGARLNRGDRAAGEPGLVACHALLPGRVGRPAERLERYRLGFYDGPGMTIFITSGPDARTPPRRYRRTVRSQRQPSVWLCRIAGSIRRSISTGTAR